MRNEFMRQSSREKEDGARKTRKREADRRKMMKEDETGARDTDYLLKRNKK